MTKARDPIVKRMATNDECLKAEDAPEETGSAEPADFGSPVALEMTEVMSVALSPTLFCAPAALACAAEVAAEAAILLAPATEPALEPVSVVEPATTASVPTLFVARTPLTRFVVDDPSC